MPRPLLLSLLFSSSLCAQNAYCVDTNLDILYSLDLTTGAVTAIGSTLSGGVMGTPADLCWRDDTSEIWTIDLAGGEAGTIDPATGLFTTVWNTGVSGWQGMAWDHTTSQFFCHNQNDQLHRLDPTTGTLTLVGTLSPTTPLVTGIDIDATGRLWAIDFAGAFFELDKNTGLAIAPAISTLPVNNLQSLSIDPAGVWYGISTATDSLYTIDPITGVCTLIGPNTGTQFVKGMVITAPPAPGTATNTTLGTGCGTPPLGLTAATRPILGTNWNLTTGNIPATGVFGVDIFGVADPGILDLFFLGMPGCQLRSTLDVLDGPWAVGGATHNYSFAVPAAPPSLIGLELFTQSAVFQVPPVNPFGAITSNGIKGTLGNL